MSQKMQPLEPVARQGKEDEDAGEKGQRVLLLAADAGYPAPVQHDRHPLLMMRVPATLSILR